MTTAMEKRARELLGDQVGPPVGVWLTPDALAALAAVLVEEFGGQEPGAQPTAPLKLTWRERLWLVPAQTRIGVSELVEAIGRPKSWVYRHTGPSADSRLPHRKLDGELVFTVGELRAWIREHEEVEHAGEMESTEAEHGIRRAVERAYSGRHLTPVDGDAA